MSGWKAKRFWAEARAIAQPEGYAVHLDGRPVRTPARTPMLLPNLVLAEAVAAEWAAQQGEVDPLSMPLTRAANSAIDTIGPNRAAVVDLIAAYGASDLLCYRAEGPAELVALQAEGWDPLLDWAAATLAAPLRVTAGIIAVEQPVESLSRLAEALHRRSDFELAALHDLVALSGSLILGLAVGSGHLAPEPAWGLSRIDEDFQARQWGVDDEAAAMAERKRMDFIAAARLMRLAAG